MSGEGGGCVELQEEYRVRWGGEGGGEGETYM